MGAILLIIALTLNAMGNILLKLGAGNLHELKGLGLMEMLPKILTNYLLLGGIACYAVNVLFYAAALNRLNLSIAYPIMVGGGLLIISLFSTIQLKESLTLLQITGIALIGLGVVFLASHA